MLAIYSLGVKHYAVITDALILLMTGVYFHVALRLFAALPLEPIADAIEGAGMGWQCEW